MPDRKTKPTSYSEQKIQLLTSIDASLGEMCNMLSAKAINGEAEPEQLSIYVTIVDYLQVNGGLQVDGSIADYDAAVWAKYLGALEQAVDDVQMWIADAEEAERHVEV